MPKLFIYNLMRCSIIYCRIARSFYLKLDRDERVYGRQSLEFDNRGNRNIIFNVFEFCKRGIRVMKVD